MFITSIDSLAGLRRQRRTREERRRESKKGRDGRKQENRAVATSQGNRAIAAPVLFGLKFVDNIHYKFKSSQASKARLQSSKHTGAINGVNGKAIRH